MMTEAVVVAIIAAVQAAIVTLLARQSSRFKRIASDAAMAREQTENEHVDINLRDDLDDKHVQTGDKLDMILATLHEHSGSLIGVSQDLRQLRVVDINNGRDVADLRATVNNHLEWSRQQAEIIQQLKENNP